MFVACSQADRIVRLQSFCWLPLAKHANVRRCPARIKAAREPVVNGQRPANGAKSWQLEALIIFLIIGAIAGWLAGQIMTGGGFGLIGNIVVGIVGAFVAGFLLPGFFRIGGGYRRCDHSLPRSARSSCCSYRADQASLTHN